VGDVAGAVAASVAAGGGAGAASVRHGTTRTAAVTELAHRAVALMRCDACTFCLAAHMHVQKKCITRSVSFSASRAWSSASQTAISDSRRWAYHKNAQEHRSHARARAHAHTHAKMT
jgi:hypothetical protein